MTRQKKSERGFSLLELSIVLGVVGVVIGGVWVTAASARRDMMAGQLEQNTLTLVDNVRQYYSARALPAAAIAAATLTSTLRTASVFPESMCPANCVSGAITTVYNDYNGTVTVAIPTGTAPINMFDVTYTRLDEVSCMQLGTRLSARASEYGLTSYTVDTAMTSFPLPFATLDSECDPTNNTVVLRFALRH